LGLSVRLLEIGALDSQHPATPLIIQMDAKTYGALAFYVNSKETAPGALENELRRDLDASAHRIAYVEAESNARWTDVVNVIDTVKGLGADVVLITACPIKSERKSVREEHAPPSPVNYLREKN
jgi:biopolymer transport protein ExbD